MQPKLTIQERLKDLRVVDKHLTLEQLMKAESLNEKIKELIVQTGR